MATLVVPFRGPSGKSRLDVRDDAARAALVAETARRLHVDARTAERTVDDTNRQREQYVRKHWGRDWRSPENYHLCLNTEWLGMDGAAEIVVRLARERFGTRDSGAQRVARST
jgi:hypothetical protein